MNSPKVSLTYFTGKGAARPDLEAARLLVFTKSTRLQMNPATMTAIASMPEEELRSELEYMANTIPSSWEFIDYVFIINDVTRAFTHQFVRTRTGTFAQQTMRVLDKKGWTYATGPTIEADLELTGVEHNGQFEQIPGLAAATYHETMRHIARAYDVMIEEGIAIEDARGVLPTNIHTNIVAKFNLRTLSEMFRKRASGRTQGEYREVIDAMKAAVLNAHPWASLFLDRSFDRAAAELESDLRVLAASGQTLDQAGLTDLVKKIDQMRMMA